MLLRLIFCAPVRPKHTKIDLTERDMSRSSGSALRAPKLTVELLEDRTVPTFLPRTGLPSPALINGQPFPAPGTGGLSNAIGYVIPEFGFFNFNEYVLATGPGVPGTVSVYDLNGNLARQFVPFFGYLGGLNVAVGDVSGDSRSEIVVSTAGAGPPIVAVFTADGLPQAAFFAFPVFYGGGVNVAVGNVMPGVGQTLAAGAPGQPGAKSEIIVGTALQASGVQVFDGSGNLRQSFFAFGAFTGGITIAAASIDNFRSSANPFAPDTNAYAELIVGAATQLPAVGVFRLSTGAPTMINIFFAFDFANPANRAGVTVAAGSTNGNGDGTRGAEIYVGLTNSSARIRGILGDTGQAFAEFIAFPPGYTRVVNMAVGNIFFSPFVSGASDLAIVTGDGPFFQRPRIYFGSPGAPAPFNGP